MLRPTEPAMESQKLSTVSRLTMAYRRANMGW
jgi:hypothetical protein